MRAELNDADLSEAYLQDANLSEAVLQRTKFFCAWMYGINLSGADLEHADLSNAVLTSANLTNADLAEAYLISASLGDATLQGAQLRRAHLPKATPYGADLKGATLVETDLSEALLNRADLRGADLRSANLSGSQLRDAKLFHADLRGTKLARVDLLGADVARVKFEPDSLPELRGIAGAMNLEALSYDENPDRLAELGRQFKEEGFRDQERKITYALKRTEAQKALQRCRGSGPETEAAQSFKPLACVEYVFSTVLFDLTCQYGMSPSRLVLIGFLLWLACSFVYFVIIHKPGDLGLYRIDGPDLVRTTDSKAQAKKIEPRPVLVCRWGGINFLLQECRVFGTAMFFSAMSASNIGFREINFGAWIRMLTRLEFEITACGWARTVSGWQSLISGYLVALWVLTYFGRPFQ